LVDGIEVDNTDMPHAKMHDDGDGSIELDYELRLAMLAIDLAACCNSDESRVQFGASDAVLPITDGASNSVPFESGEWADDVSGGYEDDSASQATVLDDAMQPLLLGAQITLIAFVVMLMNICADHFVPNRFVDELLSLLKNRVLLIPNLVPKNMYFAKRLLAKIGFNYQNIHACPNHHMLYYAETSHLESCVKCGEDRFKSV
jgi:hypothetical protein